MRNVSFDNWWLLLIAVPLAVAVVVPYLWAIRKENKTKATVTSLILHIVIVCIIALALAGSVIVALADTSSGGADALRGDLLALFGAVCVAVYTMIGAVCRRTVSTTVYTFVVYLTAAMTVAAAALLTGTPLTGYDAAD